MNQSIKFYKYKYTGDLFNLICRFNKKVKDLLVFIEKQEPLAIYCIRNTDFTEEEINSLYLDAVSRNGLSLCYVNIRTYDLCKTAVMNTPKAFIFVPDEYRESLYYEMVISTAMNRYSDDEKVLYLLSESVNTGYYAYYGSYYIHIYPNKLHDYFFKKSLYKILHNIFLSQLNLMEIAANSDILIDVYNIISEQLN